MPNPSMCTRWMFPSSWSNQPMTRPTPSPPADTSPNRTVHTTNAILRTLDTGPAATAGTASTGAVTSTRLAPRSISLTSGTDSPNGSCGGQGRWPPIRGVFTAGDFGCHHYRPTGTRGCVYPGVEGDGTLSRREPLGNDLLRWTTRAERWLDGSR